MRILHFIDSLDYGGAETLLMSYIPQLAEYNHTVVTLRGPNVYGTENFTYINLNASSVRNHLKIVFTLRKIIKEKKIAIVHSHSFWTNIISRLATKGTMPLINHYHFADYHTGKNKTSVQRMIFIDRITQRKSLIRVAVSKYVAGILNNTFPKSIVKVIPNFVGCRIAATTNRTLPSLEIKVVAVGNCNLEKNYAFVLQAFELLKDEPITIDIFGSGEALVFYQNEVRRLGLSKIRFRGSVGDVSKRLMSYDLFLSASVSETFGIAVLEAVCAKLPLLISDIPAFNEIAPQGSCFFDPYNLNDLVAKLKNFSLEKGIDHEEYDKVLNKYSAGAFIDNIRNLYSKECVALPDL